MKIKAIVRELTTGYNKNGGTYKTYRITTQELKPFVNKSVEIEVTEVI